MPTPELSLQQVRIGTEQNSRRPKGFPERFLTLEPLRGLALSRSTRGVLRRDQLPLGLIVRQSYQTVRSRYQAPKERNLYSYSDLLIVSSVRSGIEHRIATASQCSQIDVAPTELDAFFLRIEL